MISDWQDSVRSQGKVITVASQQLLYLPEHGGSPDIGANDVCGGQFISSPAVKKTGATHQESSFLGHGPGQATDSARSIRPFVMVAPPKTLL